MWVCPTGASKRAEDGIVLVNENWHRLWAVRLVVPLRAGTRPGRGRDEECTPASTAITTTAEEETARLCAYLPDARHFGDLAIRIPRSA